MRLDDIKIAIFKKYCDINGLKHTKTNYYKLFGKKAKQVKEVKEEPKEIKEVKKEEKNKEE